ncbi:hypothetical protein [Mongoliitalea daihaiensis]|uniref:hypothetical protein n=1 Tax=Mongoliitalea daihaiensis TaxID=2782006 RepID=UPI001F1953BC|nr:hypothetical protein [Mongoliitalea daihaiensis]UJP63996.1 hypothetical protein IPZ59_14355 [Mongoliitalea daihaiensis]
MIYRRKRKAKFGLDLSQLKLKNALENNPTGVGQAAGGVGNILRNAGTRDIGFGVSHTSTGANIGASAMEWAGKGAQFGKFGLAAGALVGGVMGLIGSRNSKRKAYAERDSRELQAIEAGNADSRSVYNQLEANMMEDGGQLPPSEDEQGEEQAVILGGKRHSEGGNDVIDESGEKVAETEREEIIFTKEQTELIETLCGEIKQGDETAYERLGSYIKDIILNRTKDNSGKFNELENANISKETEGSESE